MKLTMLHSAMPTKTCSRASLHISFTQTSHCVFHINSKQVNPHFTDRYFRLKLKGTWYYVCHAATCGHTVIKGQDHTKTTVREQGTGLVRSWKDRIHHPNLCSKFQTQRCKWVEFPRFLLCFKRFSPLLQFSPHQKNQCFIWFHLIQFDLYPTQNADCLIWLIDSKAEMMMMTMTMMVIMQQDDSRSQRMILEHCITSTVCTRCRCKCTWLRVILTSKERKPLKRTEINRNSIHTRNYFRAVSHNSSTTVVKAATAHDINKLIVPWLLKLEQWHFSAS